MNINNVKDREKDSILNNLDNVNEKLSQQELDEKALKLLVTRFDIFLKYVFNYLNLPSPSPVQDVLAKELGKNPDRLIINAFRGFGKSIITAIFVSWRLLRNPNEKILIVGGNSTKSKEIAIFVRKLLDLVPILKILAPHSGMLDSAFAFEVRGASDTTIAPSVKVVGIMSNFTGSRASLVLADDIEVPQNSCTQELRAKLKERVEEFEALLIPEIKDSIIFLGTPQSSKSIYRDLPYETIVIPVEVPEDHSVYHGNLHPFVMKQGKVGEPVDKVRFPSEMIMKRKKGYSTSGYKLQFMLDTQLNDEEKFPLKLRDLIVTPLNSKEGYEYISKSNAKDYKYGSDEFQNIGFDGDGFYKPSYLGDKLEYEYKFMAIDPSGRGADETACIVCGVVNGYIYVLEVLASRDGASDKTLNSIANLAKKHSIEKIIIESNFGVYLELLTKHLNLVYQVDIEEIKSKGQKEKRIIETIEPPLRDGKIIIDYNVVMKDLEFAMANEENISYSLLNQLVNITLDRGSLVHDDRLDALAMCVQHVAGDLITDAEIEAEKRKDQELLDFLNEKIYGKNMDKSVSIINNY